MDFSLVPPRSEKLPTPRDATVPTHKRQDAPLVTAPTIGSVRRTLRLTDLERDESDPDTLL